MTAISKYSGTFWILGAACSYATVAIFGKWIFALGIPVWTALSWRFAVAALVFWVWIRGQKMAPVQGTGRCFLIGLLGDTCRTTLFFLAIGKIGASLASLLLYTFPFFVFLLQRVLFKRSATRVQWLGLLLSSLGCFISIANFQGESFKIADWLGILCGIGAGFAEAMYITFSDHFTKGLPTPLVASYVTRGAFLSFFSITFFAGQLALPSTFVEWTLALSIGVCATVVPIFCLMRGIQMTGATQASLLFTIEPVITIFLAVSLFDESFTLPKIIGSLLILGSALLIQTSKEKLVTS